MIKYNAIHQILSISLALSTPLLTADSSNNCRSLRLCGQCGLKQCKGCCKQSCPPNCRSLIIPRSQNANESLFIARPHCDPLHYLVSGIEGIYEYQQSFRTLDIAAALFNTDTVSFSGNQVEEGLNTDLIADQFGLSPLYQGTFSPTPQITNHNLHLQGIWCSSCHLPGLFVRGTMTVSHQTRRLISSSTPDSTDDIVIGSPFPPGYMGSTTTNAAASLQQALSGTFLFGDMQTPWSADRIDICTLSTTQLAGATFDLGYTTEHTDTQGYSAFIRYRPAVGTEINGSQAHASELFFPIVGAGHHQEIGAGGSLRGILWCDGTGRSVAVIAEGYATHLLNNCQKRTFDLTGRGCLSRYMLLKEIDTTTSSYTGNLIPAVNWTTRTVQISVAATGEVAAQIVFTGHHSTIIIGYELFGREEEKLCLLDRTTTSNGRGYGIKGCTGTDGFTYLYDPQTNTIEQPIAPCIMPLNTTSTHSTITTCSTADVHGGDSTQQANTVAIAWNNPFDGNGDPANAVVSGTLLDDLVIATTSTPPQLLTIADIDQCSGTAPKQISHKGVIAFNYRWDKDPATPYLGIGIEAEGSGEAYTIKQWGLWLRAGGTF